MLMVESLRHFNNKPVIVVMGSSGCGKSTIAKALSSSLDLPYVEGDELHPDSNIKKMSNGIALTDDDRWPWFSILGSTMAEQISKNGGVVTACSSLKRAYRDYITKAIGAPTLFVFLDVNRESLLQRMQSRSNHYMPAGLLDSQLAILEPPESDEFAIRVDGDLPVDEIVSLLTSQI